MFKLVGQCVMVAVATVALAFAASASAAEHPIDKAVSLCILNGGSVAAHAKCHGAAADEWEDEVERVYEFLEERYEDQNRPNELSWLQTGQQQWDGYRQFYFQKLTDSCKGNKGCLAQTAGETMRFWRTRYFELEKQIDCQDCFEPFDGQQAPADNVPDVTIQPILE